MSNLMKQQIVPLLSLWRNPILIITLLRDEILNDFESGQTVSQNDIFVFISL